MKNLNTILKQAALLIALLTIAGSLVGCGTVHGVGQDIQSIGKGLQDTAQ